MKLLHLLMCILLVNLSGCVGYYKSENSSVQTKEVNDEFTAYFDAGNARVNHPENGIQRYKEETKWCGLTIWAVIPIPLLLPVCSSYTELTFKNGVPVKRADQYVKGGGYLCGPLVLVPTSMDHGTPSICSKFDD